MAHWFPANSKSIGNTPLACLNRIVDTALVTLPAKVEGLYSAYSVKRCTGTARLNAAEQRDLLRLGTEIIQAASSTSGIGAGSLPNVLDLSLVPEIAQEGLFDPQGLAA